MAKYASGKRSYGIDDQSGFKVPYRKLKKQWDGLKVAEPDFDTRHPQLDPPPASKLKDAQALHDPRPDNDNEAYTIRLPMNLFPTVHLGLSNGRGTVTIS